MKQAILIDARREGYSLDQVHSTMTVEDLIAYLEQFDNNTKVYLSHDRGYTYGGITFDCFEEADVDDDSEPRRGNDYYA